MQHPNEASLFPRPGLRLSHRFSFVECHCPISAEQHTPISNSFKQVPTFQRILRTRSDNSSVPFRFARAILPLLLLCCLYLAILRPPLAGVVACTVIRAFSLRYSRCTTRPRMHVRKHTALVKLNNLLLVLSPSDTLMTNSKSSPKVTEAATPTRPDYYTSQ